VREALRGRAGHPGVARVQGRSPGRRRPCPPIRAGGPARRRHACLRFAESCVCQRFVKSSPWDDAPAAVRHHGRCMPRPWKSCAAQIRLDAMRIAWLSDLPNGLHVVWANRSCELEARHRCLHAALGQQSGEGEWWIRWGPPLAHPTIAEVAPCPNGDAKGPDGDAVCLLFEGHPGHHTFETRPVRP